MHLHPHCFSYALVDMDLNKIVDFDAKTLNQPLGKFILADSVSLWYKDNESVLSLPFKSSKVAIYSPEYTVLPEKTDNASEVFRHLGFMQNENCTYLKNKICNEFYVYYAVQDKLINYIENTLVNVEFYCCDYGLLHFYNNKLSFKDYIAANVYGGELTISLKKNNANLFYNKFPIKAKEDLLYYLRLAYEQLDLDMNSFPTFLYGFIEEKSPMYSTSYGFIRNLEIDRTLKNTLPFTYSIEDIALHYYINLVGLGL